MKFVGLRFSSLANQCKSRCEFLTEEKEKINVMNRDAKGSSRCYFCDGLIPDAELVIMPVPLIVKGSKVKNYKRKLHASCALEYSEKRKDLTGSLIETDHWNELYEYVRELMYGKGVPVPTFMRLRLQGMRVGRFMLKGANTKLLGRGYSYPTIKKTFMFCKPTIVNMLQTQHYADEDHRINAVMYVIDRNIAEVDRRIRNQESASNKLDSAISKNKISTREEESPKYVKQEAKVLPTRKFDSQDEYFDSLFD